MLIELKKLKTWNYTFKGSKFLWLGIYSGKAEHKIIWYIILNMQESMHTIITQISLLPLSDN
jgi:hypothetical protein